MDISLDYVNVSVTDFERAIGFYQNDLGLSLNFRDDSFQYASFAAGAVALAVVHSDDPALVGRHTGVGLVVKDLDTAYAELRDRVNFTMAPTNQPWGGYMAMIADPDGNQFYLDQIRDVA